MGVPEKTKTSKFIGVYYHEANKSWRAKRWSKAENKMVSNGAYKDEETAAHASDTFARKLMESGKQKLKLNFPDDHTEVYPEEKILTSKYFGVFYDKNKLKCHWKAQRWSKNEHNIGYNGYYDDEDTAAHAS